MNYTIQDKRRTATPLFPNTKLSDATTHTELQGLENVSPEIRGCPGPGSRTPEYSGKPGSRTRSFSRTAS
jgi:hypothetical protein